MNLKRGGMVTAGKITACIKGLVDERLVKKFPFF